MIIAGETLRAAAAIAEGGLFPPSAVEVDEVSRMSLGRFSASGMAVAVVSSFLPGVIWLVADRAAAARMREANPEAITYTSLELDRLLEVRPSRETLRAIHEAKRELGGRLVRFGEKK